MTATLLAVAAIASVGFIVALGVFWLLSRPVVALAELVKR